MTFTCNKCGIVKGFIEEKGNQTGLYCNKCGKWIKWLTKDEKRLFAHNYKSKMTNADRIKSMNDEELAEFIEQVSTDSMETISFGTKEYEEIWEHKETALQWLQSEVEE